MAWGAARDAAWGAAWGAEDILATHTKSYKLNTPFVKLVDIWEMGLYPIGVIDGKFVVYVPPCNLLADTDDEAAAAIKLLEGKGYKVTKN